MDNMSLFKFQIYKYTLIVALLFEAGSLPFLGFDIGYLYGLALGACISIVSFNILFFFSEKVLATGKKFLAPLGYMVRLPLYGVAVYMSYRISTVAVIACLLGLFSVQVAMVYVHGIKRKRKKEG